MGLAKKHPPVKLVIGFIFKEDPAFCKAKIYLEKYFGKIDFESEPLPFVYTRYYQPEFGENLTRRFIAFKKFVPAHALAKIKIITNRLEKKLSSGTSRRINIDPGYIDLSKLVLATTKDHMHRIYLRDGIYAEVTLYFQDKKFNAWDWTYADYRSPQYLAIFNQIRDVYARQIK